VEIVCPTCNAQYRVNVHNLPEGKRVTATCKKCGGKIVVQEAPPPPEAHGTIPLNPPPFPEAVRDTGSVQDSGQFEFERDEREGKAFNGYAGFWKRFVAALIDSVVLFLGGIFLGGFVGFSYGVITGSVGGIEPFANLAGILMGWLYYAFMESSSKQATLGKMLMKIKVSDLSGQAISFGRATARHFAKILSAIPLAIGYLMAAFTKKKQGLHDMIAGCVVVNTA